jgi:hypothetical protein
MMEKTKRLFAMLMILFMSLAIFGQDATTSSMNGKIVDSKGMPLPGSTIVAIHVPSGSIYGAAANTQGFYSIQGMRPGGPYKVEISFVGYSKKTFTDINLQLGETYAMSTGLTESSTELNEVVIVGVKPSAFNTEKTGATTNVNKQAMSLVPSLNRSLSDYTKLSPYGSGGGSFVGREAYMTNVTVDGANFNNNFGLSSGNMPGVSGEPISMESIEEIQVAVAPFDVRQSNFTGAGVNAITKSGTNQFKGTLYGFYRNQDFSGKYIKDTRLTITESAKKAYGFNLSGPIIKDKLFFFISGEMENTLTPGNTLMALQDATHLGDGTGERSATDLNTSSRVYADSLMAFSSLLKSKYGYETGRYENWGGDQDINNKVLVKLDWNITKNHRFTIRYNYSEAKSQSRPSSSGDASPSINGGRHARTGGMSYENSQYYNSSKLHSLTAELNSRFGQLSNKLLVAYTKYTQPRSTTSADFPFIDIMSGTYSGTSPNLNLTGDVYMSAGYELFSYKNNVDNNTLIVTDNLTYQLNNHTFTLGFSYEQEYFANSYLRQGSGYYRFKNLQAFQNYTNKTDFTQPFNENNSPLAFGYTYPINGRTNPVAELTFGQAAAYLQDEFSLMDNLKVTAGLRIDLPMYLSGAVDNPVVKNYAFNQAETVDLSTWPDAKILWSPRLGFNWDVLKNKALKVRGGTGVFTGRIPFVWFTNQPTNSGMLQYQYVVSQGNNPADASTLANRAILARIPFASNAADLLNDPTLADIFPQSNPVGGKIAAIAKDFKLPQVWRTSLAVDIKLPLNMLLTLEGIHTKDINSIWFKNINLVKAASTIQEGMTSDPVPVPITRPYWSNNSNATKYLTQPYQNVVIMENTNLGSGYTLAASLDLPRIAGFSGMISYSKSWGEEVTGKTGSDPFSAWQYRVIKNSLNWQELGLTANNTPHRVVGAINYSIEYFKFFSSTLSFFFTGYKGDAFSYIYSGDANSDGTSSHELMYIPKNANEFIWSTPQDAAAYFAFAAQDPYLSVHQGEYAYRNAAYNPWNKRLDMRFLQDFKVKAGKSTNTLELSIDVINFMNLLNPHWGINQSLVTNSPIVFGGKDATTGKLKASMRKVAGQYVTNSYQDPSTVAATYGIQIGVRYIFN